MLALILVVISYYWFFYIGGRRVLNDGGNQQLLLFPLAVMAAIIFTFIISSLININSANKNNRVREERVSEAASGVELSKEMTWLQALRKPKPTRKG